MFIKLEQTTNSNIECKNIYLLSMFLKYEAEMAL